jgi:hypothetical protein
MMKNRIESALNAILDKPPLRELWEFSLSNGGAEKIIQACLAQELNDKSYPNTFIEFEKADIAIFDDGTDMPPTHIIEIGTNYLGQKDAENKPLKDIFKRTSNDVSGATYSFENVYSLMFIAEKTAGNEGIFPHERKPYINEVVKESKAALDEIQNYWISYIESSDTAGLVHIGNKSTPFVDFARVDGLNRNIQIDDMPSFALDNHKLHCYLIQIK